MEYQYEPVKHQLDIPIKIFTHTVEQYPYHWHEEMEILFILEGALDIRVDQTLYELKAGDLFLVNNNALHFIKSKTDFGKTQLLALQFTGRSFGKFKLELENRRFYLNSSSDQGSEAVCNHIKHILASLMDLVLNQTDYYQLTVEKHMLDLLLLLLQHFEVEHHDNKKQVTHDIRLLEILKYVNESCTDSGLSLTNIAEKFYLNPQYLSRYFKQQVGISLKKFIDNMRFNKSLMDLRTTHDRVLDIALKFGFPDAKSYYRVSKEVLNLTPMQYREQHQFEIDHNIPTDYFSINSKEALKKLFKYLHIENKVAKEITVSHQHHLDMSLETTEMNASYKTLMTFGYAPHGLRSDFKEQLHMIQKDIGFDYVRFHGIFSDEMLVYNETSNHDVYYNFNHVDVLIDTLLEANLKPFIELGFMPSQLASTSDTIFWWQAYVSPPKELSKWVDLIKHFFKHLINRYGIIEVKTWYFEFWNEPEIERFFWYGSKETFFEFFKATYRTVKEIHPELKIGGFGNIIFDNVWAWLEDFNDYATENQLKLDFFSFHVYNLCLENSQYTQDEVLASIDLSSNRDDFSEMVRKFGVTIGSESYMTECIDQMISKLNTFESTEKEYWITEWNANTDSRDLVHDTCYMASFIVKNVLANMDKVKGLGFWTFSDLFEEHQLEQPLFHGGFGLMTYNGIKKPSYHAYYFLNQLGEELVLKEESFIVTRTGDDYQILLFNYCHTNNLYNHLDYSQISMKDRYNVFEKGTLKNLEMHLNGLKGNYQKRIFRCNRDYGSSYDAWVEMGAPELIDQTTLNHLKHMAEPSLQIETISIDGYILSTTLDSHEIQFIELKKIY